MGIARLGNYTFRLDPDQIHYDFKVDYSVIDTIGGQVVQVIGCTVGDITITGSFGQDHKNDTKSWELAESFHATIRSLIDAQTLPNQGHPGQTHTPITFSYMDESIAKANHSGVHNWNFKVLIKGISDPDGNGSIDHSNGKFAYRYTLTLFIVEDSSLALKKIATDQFISRFANGLNWSLGDYNGSATGALAEAYIKANSGDGTLKGYLTNLVDQAGGG